MKSNLVQLSDLCDSIDYGYTQSSSIIPNGPKFLRITDIVKDSLDWNAVPYCEISEKDFQNYRLNDGDIVIARTGASTGSSCYVHEPPKSVFASYLIRLKITKCNPLFISYFLRSQIYKNYIYGVLGEKSAQPNANAKTLTQIKFNLPDKNTQDKNSMILFALDKKILLLKNQNALLEKLIQSFFQSWFVDFDNQKEFIDSELGRIPKGWVISSIGELCQKSENGGTPRRNNSAYWEDGKIPWFKTGELDDGPLLDSEEHINHLGLEESSCKFWVPGTILIAMYGATAAKIGFLTSSSTSNQACNALLAKNEYGSMFLFYTLRFIQNQLYEQATGSAQQNLNKEIISDFKIILPPSNICVKFQNSIYPIFEQIINNKKTILRFTKILESLMPKLVLGAVLNDN